MNINGLIGQPGNVSLAPGSFPVLRAGQLADLIISELHGRFYEGNYRGNRFTGGAALQAVNNATYTVATTGVTATPIIGLWNPSTSPVNAVIDQANLALAVTALQATGTGPLEWMYSLGNSSLTSGSLITPINCKTLTATGSQVKVLAGGAACTAMTGTLAFLRASILGNSPLPVSFLQTQVGGLPSIPGSTENFDGNLIVPPGGVLALMATGTPVAISALASLIWEEVPL